MVDKSNKYNSNNLGNQNINENPEQNWQEVREKLRDWSKRPNNKEKYWTAYNYIKEKAKETGIDILKFQESVAKVKINKL